MKYLRKIIILFAVLFLLPPVSAYTDDALDSLLFHYAEKKELTDWEAVVLGLNGKPVKNPLFSASYFKQTEKEIKKRDGEYGLVTDYARLALVYKTHGKDPADIAGYDLIEKITTFGSAERQGINAYCWVLIALYNQPDEITAPFIENILPYQLPSGGFSAAPPTSQNPRREDVDLTAMSITALAPYTQATAVREAVQDALDYLSRAQEEDGGFSNYGINNAESVSQVIIALCSAGVSLDDSRFIKNNQSVLDALYGFYLGGGFFAHDKESGEPDPIAARQAALALTALQKEAYIFE
jgi:hypothetical protein